MYQVKVSKIEEMCPVFDSDSNFINEIITRAEVKDSIENGNLNALSYDEYLYNYSLDDSLEEYDHIGRIAYLAKIWWGDPIVLDVGIPGYHESEWLIWDGNHRFAAAVFLGMEEICVEFSGDVDYFNELFDQKV